MTTRRIFALVSFSLLPILFVGALAQDSMGGQPPASGAGLYIDPAQLHLDYVLPPPPPADKNSEAEKADLAELHRIEQARTPAQVVAAQADEREMDIFVYRTVLGEKFSAANLPLTARLSDGVHREASAAIGPLKDYFRRLRPYQFDSTLHPACNTTNLPASYPSGHAIIGYLEGLTLAQIAPEKQKEILERADDYAHNREVCGVHYPTDVASGKEAAYAVFGEMMTSAEFQKELAAARAETRKLLGMN
jgi:acid phosphatase (class A)